MSERYVTLLGADDVRSAASTMSSAAHNMQSAASSIQHSFEMHQRFLDDWLMRFQDAMDKSNGTDHA